MKSPKTAAALIVSTIFSEITTETEREIFLPKASPEQLRELVLLTENGKLNKIHLKRILSEILKTGKPCSDFLSESEPLSDAEPETICRDIIANNEKSVADFKSVKKKRSNSSSVPL